MREVCGSEAVQGVSQSPDQNQSTAERREFFKKKREHAARREAKAEFQTAERRATRGVAVLVGIEGGVVSGVINLESSGVEASDWRPRHDEQYHDA